MRRTNRSGAAAIEFVLSLPFLVVLMFGMVEYSLFVNHFHYLQRAARDGARVGSVTLEGNNPTGETIMERAGDHALAVLEANGIECLATCEISTRWESLFGNERWIVVRVDVPYQPVTGLFPEVETTSVAEFAMLTQTQPEPEVE